jgi:hypothetical protein
MKYPILVAAGSKKTEMNEVEVTPNNRRHPVRRLLVEAAAVLALATCLLLNGSTVSAKDFYLSQGGSGTGVSCASPLDFSWFNNAANWGTGTAQIGPGTTVHVCGVNSVGANTNALIFQGDGASGNPITLLFEAGAIIQSPAFPDTGGGAGQGGGISMYGRNWITVDGGTNGIVQNTDNGDLLGHVSVSTLVDGYNCNNCTIKNLHMLNTYVKVKNGGGTAPGDQQHSNTVSGSHWSIHDNVIDNCGWCVFQNFKNGDTDTQIFNNEISHFGHALIYATSGANASSNFFLHDNRIHDAD